MASIRKEIVIDAPPGQVWTALRDWGALHHVLVPGFAVDAKLDGQDRIVTFFNGIVLREVLVDLDDEAQRLAWSITGGPYAHHNASAQAFAHGEGSTRFVWVADLLPDELADRTDQMMTRGTQVIKETMERSRER